MGVGTIKFESGANDNEGSIIVNPKSAKGEDGGEYKFKYKKLSDGKFDITNIGNSGQPNCKMKYFGNPSPEEIVADANKTVVKL